MLIAKEHFIGIDNVTHLATGGESPMLKSHEQAVAQFLMDKSLGEAARYRFESTYRRCQEKVGQLISAPPDEIAFLSHSSDGINLLAYALDWRAGDNVVVCDVEFPSDVLPWTKLADQGVELRIVSHNNFVIDIDAVAAMVDERTRVVAMSQVSYYTGQRQPVQALSEMVRAKGALLLIDATHAAGSVPVYAPHADILVSSCYKWLLGVHGAAVFYWNRERLPDLEPPFLGWNTGVSTPNWQAPTSYQLPESADRFQPGNPGFISLYVLENALNHLLDIGTDRIEQHNVHLSGMVLDGLASLGWETITPRDPAARAGNACFAVSDETGSGETGSDETGSGETITIETLVTSLKEQNILIWGDYGGAPRVRVSTHLYNDEADVAHFLDVMQSLTGH
ncbi:MAG: aminotransferase class V-fold PLP-dependent enzyme [Chloroflexota bacterium]